MTAGTTVSIREVAGAANVSVTTVSRVLNRTGPVRARTRERVEAAIQRLGYVPHAGARSLITRQTRTIGVVLPDIHGEFFSELIRGADLAARRHGYHLLVSGAHADLAETREVLRTLHGRVDGLVLMASPIDARALRDSLPATVPLVLLSDGRGGRHASIRIDNRGGARAVVEHLLERGHRRIAVVQGPDGNADAAERLKGFHEALAGRRLGLDPALVMPGDFSEKAGHAAARQLAGRTPRPTAIFATNDAMAIGCLAALRELRLRVPEDVALAGFDDIPIARYITPPLTTVHVAIDELGGRAVARLLREVAGIPDSRGRHELLPARLVIRTSTASAITGKSDTREHPSKGKGEKRR